MWFYDMTADGFSLDDKRSPVTDNDIPDIIARFRNLEAEKTAGARKILLRTQGGDRGQRL